MILTTTLQELYNNVYVHMRKYIWSFSIVELLAEIEVESYTSFPDLDLLRSKLQQLRSGIYYAARKYHDDSLIKTIDDMIDSLDSTAVPVKVIKEVTSYHENS